ncbi:MAG TPA: hypothetical protein VFV41_02160 [Streptosporangiaceae bacterium]|nr:hypothetical protein [Streptosporangiaceae bacterium]
MSTTGTTPGSAPARPAITGPATTGPASTDTAAGGRRWLMLAVLLGGQLMALLDVFVVNVALPSIRSGLDASGAMLQLVVGGYAIG